MLFSPVGAGSTIVFDATQGGDDAGKTFSEIALFVGASATNGVTFTVLDGKGVAMHAAGQEGSLLPGTGVGLKCGVRGISKITAVYAGATSIAVFPHVAA